MIAARSGRDVSEVTLDAVRAGAVAADDVRIHPDTLEHQAQVAEANANPQLAANLRRAAELTALPDDEVLSIYEALRPGRSSYDELHALAARLAERGADRNAALVREAAEIYARRGLLRP
ncbi:MAG TPA: diol dehydratase small subunit [Candidatus Nanopelagicales bacterium]|nr:diol dehydratase small subunit [Candidatus Nanopelagicales bacterium]